MKRFLLIFCIAFSGCSAPSGSNSPKFDPASEEKAIRTVLADQEKAWNEGNIDQFMEGYWKSDSLMFIGKGVTQGWNATIERYRTGYPSLEAMGKLTFTFHHFKFISDDACLVTGRYTLKRTADEPTGMFSLLLRKLNGRWIIVYDHTS